MSVNVGLGEMIACDERKQIGDVTCQPKCESRRSLSNFGENNFCKFAGSFLDPNVYESLAGRPIAGDRRWRFIGAWCLRELLALPIWVLAMLGNEESAQSSTYRWTRPGLRSLETASKARMRKGPRGPECTAPARGTPAPPSLGNGVNVSKKDKVMSESCGTRQGGHIVHQPAQNPLCRAGSYRAPWKRDRSSRSSIHDVRARTALRAGLRLV
ncbi:hypothetical protein EDB19DRAFT_2027228 [Suillus lakei]|nr:hypothetical protein EDB19DRAFT_2027228 [Suillus lakei]